MVTTLPGTSRSFNSALDKGTTLFQFCCKRVNIVPIHFNFTYTRQATSHLVINFIHVINFFSVQNVLRISVMYVMSRVTIFVLEGCALEWICSELYQWSAVRTSKAYPAVQIFSSSLQNFKVTTYVLFMS